jgi:hypothetical protein
MALRMRTHITLVGWIHVIYNLLAVVAVVGGVVLWIGTSGAIGLGTTLSGDMTPQGGAALGGLLSILGLLVGCGMLVPSLPGFLGGIGCLRERPWARLLLILVSALHVLTFVPTGIAIGLYSLWVLLQPETKAIFEGYDWIPTGDGPTLWADPSAPSAPPAPDAAV